MMATYRQLPQIDRRTRSAFWNKEDARGAHLQLQDKTIGLIGLGAVGREVAKRLRGFDTTIEIVEVSSCKAARRRPTC